MFADAQAYDRFMGRWSARLAAPFVDFVQVPERGHLLDLGSGTGSLAFAAADRHPGCSITGIDPSPEYTAFANSRNPHPKRLSFETGDAQNLSYPAARFDASLSLLVFNFIPDPRKALIEALRVTKPNGSVSAAVWDYGAGMQMLRAFWDSAVKIDPSTEPADERHMPLCRQGQLADLWRSCDLADVQEKALEITMDFRSFADYWDPFLLGQGPAGALIRRLPLQTVEALRRELKNRLSPSSASSPFSLTAKAWCVRGLVRSNA